MIDFKSFECTGCTACYNACPHAAIQMVEDGEGFKFPQIAEAKCVKCGLCQKVCIPLNGYAPQSFAQKAYGAKNKNLDERKQSQSGGVFFVLAKHILSQGGVVYGSLLGEGLIARHGRANTEETAKAFRGSKYVQSDLGNIFLNVKEDLVTGVPVLFSGTPCQVAGLKAFLRKDYENLLLVDLICHGVPSPKIWADYVAWQEKRLRGKMTKPNFRDKSYNWGSSYESFYINENKKTFIIYTKIFHSRNAFRKSCYVCPFSNTNRLSDITIGDYWGIGNVKPEFKDRHGVSAVLVNSEKGQCIWNEVCESFDSFECKTEDITAWNPNLIRPSRRPATREEFWRDCGKDFGVVAKKYGGNDLIGKGKMLIKKILGRI